MRTNDWLADRLVELRRAYFPDVPVANVVFVRFGRASRTRLGSIIAKPHRQYRQPVTYISVNALFRDETVPEFVIDATLAHEFVHYAHGFHSPLEQKYRHPHRGGIVNKEIRQRGAGELLDRQDEWLKTEYREFLRRNLML